MPNNSYADGTISVSYGSKIVTGVGTAFSTQVKTGDAIHALVEVPASGSPSKYRWELIGWPETVDGNTQITLLDEYPNESLTAAEYRIVRGYGWWTGAAPNETMVTLLTELDSGALAGVTTGIPDDTVGRENELRFDASTSTLYQKRSGTWQAMVFGPGSVDLTADDINYETASPIVTLDEIISTILSSIDDLEALDPALLGSANAFTAVQTLLGLVVGSPTGGSKGTGAGNFAAPIYINGVPLWTPVLKTADQTKTGNTTLADDNTLLFPMLASTKYAFRGRIYFDTTAAGDFKWRHVGPASPTLVRIRRKSIVPSATAYGNIAVDTAFSASDITELSGNTNGGFVDVEGIIHNGANAGNFSIQWAQNTSDAGNTVVRAGSYLEHRVVA